MARLQSNVALAVLRQRAEQVRLLEDVGRGKCLEPEVRGRLRVELAEGRQGNQTKADSYK